ncbi:MAG: HAMP domain-containing protein [Chitinispirillaceae bacterium]|nr:HAMP domain-containing protein [Chitinispirillaceae bacterium]
MKMFNTHSIIFKTALIYFFLTILNISIFVLMVFENQLDLIAENAVLTSQHKGSSLKYRIDHVVAGSSDLTPANINRILQEASALHIADLTLYSENGRVFVSIIDNKISDQKKASIDELKMINMAITKQGFEDKLFYHQVNRQEKSISLYLPFTYSVDKIGVAAITLQMKDIDRQMGYLYRQCIVVGVLVMFLHLAFAMLFSKMILFPMRQLNEATNQIAQGKLEIRIPIVRDDEIGQLASSFNEMSVALQRMRDEAKGANPLSGLPGNITIANYINECLSKGSIICVLYCDLDNFKAYNDKYGFTKGDEAILYTRDCLLSVPKRTNMRNVFIGHEGGDDFVAITDYENWELFAKSFLTTFDRGINQFYNSVDARNGFIESINRRGERQRFPLMSISVAVVTNKTREFGSVAEMIQIAAEVKKYVKSMEGSCYAIDRRTGPVRNTQSMGPAPSTPPPAPTPKSYSADRQV